MGRADLADENVLRVEQVSVSLALYHVDHPRLEVQEQRSRDVVVVVRLIEENVFSVISLETTNGNETKQTSHEKKEG